MKQIVASKEINRPGINPLNNEPTVVRFQQFEGEPATCEIRSHEIKIEIDFGTVKGTSKITCSSGIINDESLKLMKFAQQWVDQQHWYGFDHASFLRNEGFVIDVERS